MIINENNIEIPEYWYHQSNIQNKDGKTMGMQMFDNCKDISKLNIQN